MLVVRRSTCERPSARYANCPAGTQRRAPGGQRSVAARTLEVCRERGLANTSGDVRTRPGRTSTGRLDSNGWKSEETVMSWSMPRTTRPALARWPTISVSTGDGAAPVGASGDEGQGRGRDAARGRARGRGRLSPPQIDSPRCLPAIALAERVKQTVPGARCAGRSAIPSAPSISRSCRRSTSVIGGSIFLIGPLRARLIVRGALHVERPARACDRPTSSLSFESRLPRQIRLMPHPAARCLLALVLLALALFHATAQVIPDWETKQFTFEQVEQDRIRLMREVEVNGMDPTRGSRFLPTNCSGTRRLVRPSAGQRDHCVANSAFVRRPCRVQYQAPGSERSTRPRG